MKGSRRIHTACAGILIALLLSATGCDGSGGEQLDFERQGRQVPAFEADSAYRFVEQQLALGERYPGSEGHRAAKAYLIGKLAEYAGERGVYAQHFTHRGYEGDTLRLTNMIAAFNPGATDRIMLCAHWDTRPRADEDPNRPEQPIAGADDGASGVAVLLELARHFAQQPPPIGVDIVLFDGEDYGHKNDLSNYFLGSRYWAANPPVPGYRPRFGILLDMVGGEGARFPKERNSMAYAPGLVNEVWQIAGAKGYTELFPDRIGAAISDDHVVIHRIMNLPMIDIIRHRVGEDGSAEFAPYWHTVEDDLPVISRRTLGAVGEVMLELIYNRIPTSASRQGE